MKSRKLYLLIFLSVIFILCFSSLDVNVDSDEFDSVLDGDNDNKKDFNEILRSGYWELSPFILDDTGSGDYTWAEARARPWCSGLGTEGDPYLIENIVIDGLDAGDCLMIRDSNPYFIIKNCTFYNSEEASGSEAAGLYLYNANNGLIINNDFSNNNGHGLILFSWTTPCSNNTITNNTMKNNGRSGIKVRNSNCYDNNITGNYISSSGESGILLTQAQDSIVYGNEVNNSNLYGIYAGYGENLYIQSNILKNNGIYIYGNDAQFYNNVIDDSNLINGKKFIHYYNKTNLGTANFTDAGQVLLYNCNESIISDLDMSACSTGISLRYCYSNTIINNTLSDNSLYGMYLDSSLDNILINNSVFNNSVYGIYSKYSDNSTLIGNNATFNGDHGIYSLWSDDSNVSNNVVNNNMGNGIYFYGDSSVLSGNTANHNNKSGIYFSGGDNSNITKNDANNNTEYGIMINDGRNALVYSNTLSNNSIESMGATTGILTCVFIFNLCDGINVSNTLFIQGSGSDGISWDQAVNEFGIASGSGTYNDPYIIEDLFFDGLGVQSCIWIRDFYSNIYLVIRNCTLTNALNDDEAGGISVKTTHNALITNNTCKFNNYQGIYLGFSDFCNITFNNIINNNIRGIYTTTSERNNISNNIIKNNGGYGITMAYQSHYNDVFSNIIDGCSTYGMSLYYTDYSKIYSNTFKNCPSGIVNIQTGSEYTILSMNTYEGALTAIMVDDDGSNGIPWAETAAAFDNCIGSGTWNDPYRIENITIDAGGISSCIVIQDSLVYFQIRNCTLSDASSSDDAGIKLIDTVNGYITNCTILNNLDYGIYLYDHCDNNTIFDNSITNNAYGIFLDYYSDLNYILNNTIYQNSIRGLYLLDGCDTNTILYNNITYSQRGIYITFGSDWNVLYGNNFTNQIYNAEDASRDGYTTTEWNSSSIGNYWHDYTGHDADDNGIGDESYVIAGQALAEDFFPIWDDGPEFPPYFVNETNDFSMVQGNSSVNITWTPMDVNTNYDSYWIIQNGTSVFSDNWNGSQITYSELYSWSDGIHNITCFVNDTSNFINSSTVIVTITPDSSPPVVSIFEPTPNQYCGNYPPFYNVSIVDDISLNSTWYSVNGQNFTFFDYDDYFDETYWDSIGFGVLTITFYASDFAGNIGSDDVVILKPNSTLLYDWEQIWGGSDFDFCFRNTIDTSDNVYITGYTYNPGPASDLFIVKYNPSGGLVWDDSWGGSNHEEPRGMVVDSTGNVFVTGYTESYGAGNEDILLVKYNSAGAYQWYRTWGTSGTDIGYTVDVDSNDNIYVLGYRGGNRYIIKYTQAGVREWEKLLDSNTISGCYDMKIDDWDNIYVSGLTDAYGAGGNDMVLLKLNITGDLIWNCSWGTSLSEEGIRLEVDSANNTYVVCNGLRLVKFNSTGGFQWMTDFDGSVYTNPDLAIDRDDNIIVSGYMRNRDTNDANLYLGKSNPLGKIQWLYSWGNAHYLHGDIVIDSNDTIYYSGSYTIDVPLDYEGCVVKFLNVRINDYTPELTNGNVVPFSGNQLTEFNFSVVYTDQDNNAPSSVNVIINGTVYMMGKTNPFDINYTDGCLYEYLTYLTPAAFNYTYFFNCSDGLNTNSTGIFSNLEAITVNDYSPILFDPIVTPEIGINSTLFTYTINYTDADNNLPIYVNITINSTIFSMEKLVPLDTNALDGIIYFYITTFDFGFYKFQVNCSDGLYTNSTNWINKPEVNPFYGAGIINLLTPSNNTNLYTGWTNFTWDNLVVPCDTLNYTFQLSNTSDFIEILIEEVDINEIPVISNYSCYINYQSGLYYWRVRPVYKIFLGNWSDYHVFNLTYNEDTPSLNNGGVNPITGDQFSSFNFTVNYSDNENNHPIFINVTINGTSYEMTKVNSSDTNYIDGCLYQYSITLTPAVYNYTYSYECGDGKYSYSTVMYSNLFVNESNNFTPNLVDNDLNPNIGYNSTTLFLFSINYTDADNNAPIFVNITINSTIYSMMKQNSTDINYMDGCIYVFNTTLEVIGNYTYFFNCSDGLYSNSLGTFTDLVVEETKYWNNISLVGLQIGAVISHGETNPRTKYSSFVTDLINRGASISDISSTIDIDILSNYDLLWFDEYGSPLSSNELDAIQLWVQKGGRFIITGNDLGTAISLAQRFNITIISENHFGTTDSIYSHHITNGVSQITFVIARKYLDLSSQPDAVLCVELNGFDEIIAMEYGEGAFVMIMAELPSDLSSTDNHLLLNNTFGWLGYIRNDYSPTLTNGSVDPISGDQFTLYNFTVSYSDLDNNRPIFVNISINGTSYEMVKVNTSDNNYIDGCIYIYQTLLTPSDFNYSYYFISGDFLFNTSSAIYNNANSTESNFNAPQLINPMVTPDIGDNSTLFNFTIWYYDSDNNLPVQINITINSSVYLMLSANPNDLNATDGILYYYNTTLDFGYYKYQMNCSDNGFSNSTSWIIKPEVNPFYNNDFVIDILFEDDFESGVLSANWTLTGDGGVSTQTANSGIYSAYHCANPGNITLKSIDLSTYQNANVSFWVRKGADAFSEDPDTNEDFIVYYYNNLGTWIQLDSFLGSAPDGQIYNNDYSLPSDALHSNFQLRFYQTAGSGAAMDYWHLDDVKITVMDPKTILILPNNNSVINGGWNNFSWTSFAGPFGSVNYTFQVSNISDFSTLMYNQTNIGETSTTTNTSEYIFIPSGIYYWRVRPTYSIFNGNWSKTFCFDLDCNYYTPELTSESVSPLNGTQITLFNFTVNYIDLDNYAPTYINVSINGTSYGMEKVNGGDNDYTDGCLYQYLTLLAPALFNYTYNFNCSDGQYYNWTSSYYNLEVIEVNNFEPALLNPEVTPTLGNGTTQYNFTVWYYDVENNLPDVVNITILNITYVMQPFNPLDLNATDGILYYYLNNSMEFGFHVFQINCSDGVFENSTNWTAGPEVNPFYGLSPTYNVSLLTPLNDTLSFNDIFNFTWTSLEAPFGAVNFTWQLSDIIDFSNIILEQTDIEELASISNASILVDLVTGQYYWRIRPTYRPFNGTWADYYTLNIVLNNYTPSITGLVNPLSGNQLTLFNFSVEYIDIDNNAPVYINVSINGTSYVMEKIYGADNDYTDGCWYQYLTYLSPSVFNYTYFFSCGDGRYNNITASLDNLEVIEVNFNEPYLSNPQFTPIEGGNTTLFNFTVWYYDLDNNLPDIVNITLDNETYLMQIANPLDLNATDGILYYYTNNSMEFGNYTFQMNCSDGTYLNATEWLVGPLVSPFLSAPIDPIVPNNEVTQTDEGILLIWNSIEAPFGDVDYTIQISEYSNFSEIFYELSGIEETPGTTSVFISISIPGASSITIQVVFPEGEYYWRIQATYGSFSGNWSTISSFSIKKSVSPDDPSSPTQPDILLLIIILVIGSIIAVSSVFIAKRNKSTKKETPSKKSQHEYLYEPIKTTPQHKKTGFNIEDIDKKNQLRYHPEENQSKKETIKSPYESKEEEQTSLLICIHCGTINKSGDKKCFRCNNILEEPKSIATKISETITHTSVESSEDYHIGVACYNCKAPYMILKSRLDDFKCAQCSNKIPKIVYRCDACRKIFPLSRKYVEETQYQASFKCPQCSSIMILIKQELDLDSDYHIQVPLGQKHEKIKRDEKIPTSVVDNELTEKLSVETKEKEKEIPKRMDQPTTDIKTRVVPKICRHCGAVNDDINTHCSKCSEKF